MRWRCIASVSLLFLLTACGGSGGDSRPQTEADPPTMNDDGTVGLPPDATGSDIPTSDESAGQTNSPPANTPANDDNTEQPADEQPAAEEPAPSPPLDDGQDEDSAPDGDAANERSNADVIYAKGGSVPGLADAEFVSISSVAMADNGDTCMSAAYTQQDETIRSVWCGLPNNPQQILRSGDNISNLPANIVFNSAGGIEIADSGDVMIIAGLAGASDSAAALVWNGQSVNSILRTGELAPGFTDGSAITGLEIVSFSNAGAVINGTVGSFLVPAIWHWDGTSVSLVSAFSGLTSEPVDQNGCDISVTFGVLAAHGPYINNNGIIAFKAILTSGELTTDNSLCRGSAIVQYDGETYTTIVKTRDIVPATETAIFSSLTLNRLFDSNSMSITAALTDDNASGIETGRASTWIFHPDGTADLVTIIEETVPPGFVDRLTLIGHVPIVVASSADWAVQHGKTSLGNSLLAGVPHSGMPYPDIGAVGATSLSFVASTNTDAPPGFAANTFVSSFSRPAIDRSGRVFYRATVEDTGGNEKSNAFYVASPQKDPALLFVEGDQINYEGESRKITSINLRDAEVLSLIINNAPGFRISQQGHALVPVSLEGYSDALVRVNSE